MATSRFWVSFFRILVGFYLLCIFVEPKDLATEGFNNDAPQFEVFNHDAADPLTNVDGGRYELCGTDLSFLGPPYGNISTSNMVCSPIWNNFVLRVSCFNSCFMVYLLFSAYIFFSNLNELNLISTV